MFYVNEIFAFLTIIIFNVWEEFNWIRSEKKIFLYKPEPNIRKSITNILRSNWHSNFWNPDRKIYIIWNRKKLTICKIFVGVCSPLCVKRTNSSLGRSHDTNIALRKDSYVSSRDEFHVCPNFMYRIIKQTRIVAWKVVQKLNRLAEFGDTRLSNLLRPEFLYISGLCNLYPSNTQTYILVKYLTVALLFDCLVSP